MGLSNKRIIPAPVTPSGKRRRSVFAVSTGRLSPHEDRSSFRKKNVKFASNIDGTVKVHERYIDVLRKDLDKPNMFYSREEKNEILEECEEAIDRFKLQNLEETSNFDTIFKYCRQPPSQEASSLLETMQLQVPVDARGIEWGWACSVTAGYKKSHVKNLLKAQDQVNRLNETMRSQVLANRSLRSSRPGRILARLLGECDERNSKVDGP
jgi:hypothetical protein